ncbi:MAG: TetR/AcrR family transcriptional regulator [Actinobacteria bacterium]|nr:TetR/AcrR family transcriptional regulator [Actinomycetota bacterium]
MRDIACDMASKEGLEQLSMRRLASAVGMSKSGLYAHFASKEELQLATIDHVRDVFEAKVVSAPPGEPHSGLQALLERWLDFFERKVFPGGCFLITSAVEFVSRPGPVARALVDALDRELAVLETAIHRATQTGELRLQRDARQTAFELHAILMNTHALFQIKQDPAVFDKARAAIHRLIGQCDGPDASAPAGM